MRPTRQQGSAFAGGRSTASEFPGEFLGESRPAEAGDQANHFIQSQWRRGKVAAAMNHIMHELPFTGRQDEFAIEIRTFAAKAAQRHHMLGHHCVNGKTARHT